MSHSFFKEDQNSQRIKILGSKEHEREESSQAREGDIGKSMPHKIVIPYFKII